MSMAQGGPGRTEVQHPCWPSGFPYSSAQGKNQILDINIKYIDQENCLHTLYHNAIQSLKDVIKHFYQKPN